MAVSGAHAPHRVERALGTAVLCGPGSAVAHVSAGAASPGAVPVLAVSLVSLAGAGLVVLGRRRLGWLPLLGLAGGAQLLFHAVLAGTGGHHHHGSQAPSGGLSMLLLHAVVALGVAVLAHELDSAWWSLWVARAVQGAARLLRVPTPVVLAAAPAGPGRCPATPGTVPTPRPVVLEVAGPRGPPAGRRPARHPS